MKVKLIEAVGFRGIKERLSIPVPSGFLILSGRNGTGKSTVCDLVEFAFTGKLDKQYWHTERGENVSDYLWWRGDGTPSEYVVRLVLTNHEGEEFVVERGREGLTKDSIDSQELERLLCKSETAPSNPLDALCRTVLVRDESITHFSLDLKETERFSFVQSAIGTADFASVEKRVQAVLQILANKGQETQSQLDSIRNNIKITLTRLSELKSEVSASGDTDAALKFLGKVLELESGTPLSEFLKKARQRVADQRLYLDRLNRSLKLASELFADQAKVHTPDFLQTKKTLADHLKQLEGEIKTIVSQENQHIQAMAKFESSSPEVSALAQLQELGSRIGRIEGRCPLCRSQISEEEFVSHLDEITKRVGEHSSRLSELVAKKSDLGKRVEEEQKKREEARTRYQKHVVPETELDRKQQELIEGTRQLGIQFSPETDDLETLKSAFTQKESELDEIEKALTILESTRMVSQVTALEETLKVAREQEIQSSTSISNIEKAEGKVKQLSHIITRVENDFVDDRLSSISPLLSELYYRLRPHLEWTQIDFAVRGDIRRFLSLTVGNDVNPRFVFSSGQRRATGLAFLLSVYLSLSWSRFKTLLLDDPVQHIDDARSLHLTELLAAIRKSGRQIICGVEDPALASLLSRRLYATDIQLGAVVSLDYVPGRGVVVQGIQQIHPFSRNVLQIA